jgi:hypothetical protein
MAGGGVTEILACYGIEATASGPATTARLCAETDDSSRLLFGCDASTLFRGPGRQEVSQGFVQERADGVKLTLVAENVIGEDGAPGTVTQTTIVPFVSGRVVDVSLMIEASCIGLVCRLDETCVGGVCVPAALDPSCLPTHGHGPPTGCTDPRVTRGCAITD